MIKIVDFYADWCYPCKMLAPILEDIEQSLDYVKVEKVNVEQTDESTEKYGIKNIPTLLIFKDDELVDKIVGLVPQEKILKVIEK